MRKNTDEMNRKKKYELFVLKIGDSIKTTVSKK